MVRQDTTAEEEGVRDMRAPSSRMTTVGFAGLPHIVELHDADEIHDMLQTVLPDWGARGFSRIAAGKAPHTTIRGTGDRYSFHSFWSRRPLKRLGPAGATCGAVADIVQAYLDARPGVIGLHCGAVRVNGRLLAFTGTYRAGKTTLVTRLGTAPDCALFCDDVLPVDDDGAVALGVQPRLRLPLPDSLPPGFKDFVAKNLTVHDHRYGYVDLPGQATFGTRAPLDALILLSRQDGAQARFHRLDTGEAAAHLIRQNIADPGEVGTHYDRIAAMAEGLICLALVYSDLEEAVALVRATFAGSFGEPDLADIAPPLDPVASDEPAGPADLNRVFAWSEGVVEQVIGADTFLWQMDGRNFFSLNPVGGVVWALLETPASGDELAAALHTVFPDIPAATVARDVANLLGHMAARGLIESQNAGPVESRSPLGGDCNR